MFLQGVGVGRPQAGYTERRSVMMFVIYVSPSKSSVRFVALSQ